jgi:transposase
MLIIGCDYHQSFEQIAFLDTATGEQGQVRLDHRTDEAERFYAGLCPPARVGIEATGRAWWFERMPAKYGHELWVGDAARIRAAEVRKQKTDRRDAELLLRLMVEGRFPRIWTPSEGERDHRQLVLHRHHLVQLRTKVKNQLQAPAMNEGVQQRRRLWSQKGREQLRGLALSPWAARRREDLLQLLEEVESRIAPLDKAIVEQAESNPVMRRLMTHPGVGPVVSSAFALTLGEPQRFANSRKLISYLGLAPTEYSSAAHQRLGHISGQGNKLLRSLLVEAAHTAVRFDPGWKRQFLRVGMKKSRQVAIVAIARKLAIRLWWMWKLGLDYPAIIEPGSHVE